VAAVGDREAELGEDVPDVLVDGVVGDDEAAGRAQEVRSSNVKWLTPRPYRMRRDVGLRGYAADLRRDPSWRGRHDGRNAAYSDLLLGSGLRRGGVPRCINCV